MIDVMRLAENAGIAVEQGAVLITSADVVREFAALLLEESEKLTRDLEQENAALRKALTEAAFLNPSVDSVEGYNEWGEADCFNKAQGIACAALRQGKV